jgi:hypothetical protein
MGGATREGVAAEAEGRPACGLWGVRGGADGVWGVRITS